MYLRIPGQRAGRGKIQVSVRGAFKELDAITDQDTIESGANIRIIKIENQNLVLVEKI
ncbi:hypothetical protein D3C87_1677810 [compost metagenome]